MTSVSPVWNLLTLVFVLGIAINKSLSQEDSLGSLETHTESLGFQTSENENEIPGNRVLPVDAEHKNKITFQQKPLDPICVKTLQDNLLKFLERVKKSNHRKGRQDDGDDDGDGEDAAGGLAGVLGGLGGGDGALAALSAVPQVVPQLVSTLTQLSGAINQGLNGTDTPNIPSFLAKNGVDAIKFFQAIVGQSQQSSITQHQLPSQIHVQRIPGGPPMRKPRPPGPSSIPTNSNYEGDLDYPDEDVKQPQQQSPLKPLHPGATAGAGPQFPEIERIPGSGNTFLQNAGIIPSNGKPRPPVNPGIDLNGLPEQTSLWNIYKSLNRNRNSQNGSLSNFQLAHPEAFSNELLQSISQSISNVRGQTPIAVATDKPSSEIFKEFIAPKPPAFSNVNRPSIPLYRPRPPGALSGVLNNLEINAPTQNENSFYTNPNVEVEQTTFPPSVEQEQELDSIVAPGLGQRVPGGSQSTANGGLQSPANGGSNSGNKAHLAFQQQELLNQYQAITGSGNKNQGNNNMKPPTSSHLNFQVGDYMSAVASLHEGVEIKVGPQTNHGDDKNGFRNKSPYKTTNGGILVEAPRLTPSPLLNQKRPSGISINYGQSTETTPVPDFSYQFANRPGVDASGSTLFFPPGAAPSPPDPNAPRAPTVSAAISSHYEQQPPQRVPISIQNPQSTNGVLPPSLIQSNVNIVPESQAFPVSNPVHPIEAAEKDIGSISNSFGSPITGENSLAPVSNPPISPSISDTPNSQNTASQQNHLSLYNLYNLLSADNLNQLAQNSNNNIANNAEINNLNSPSDPPFTSNLMNNVNQPQNQLSNNPLFQQQAIINNLNIPQSQTSNSFQASNPSLFPEIGNTETEGINNNANSQASDIVPEFQKDIESSLPNQSGSFGKPSTTPVIQNPDNSQQFANFYPFPNTQQFASIPSLTAPTAINGPVEAFSPNPANVNNSSQSLGANWGIQSEVAAQQNAPTNNALSFSNQIGLNPSINVQNFLQSAGLTNLLIQKIPENSIQRNETDTSSTTNSFNSQPVNEGDQVNIQDVDLGTFPQFPSHSQSSIYPSAVSTSQNKQSQNPSLSQLQNLSPKPVVSSPATVNNQSSAQNVNSSPLKFPQFANYLGLPHFPNNNIVESANESNDTNHLSSTAQPDSVPSKENINLFPDSFLPISGVYTPPQSESKPLIIGGSDFQGPVQNTGYPSFVPSVPLEGSPSNFHAMHPGYELNLGIPIPSGSKFTPDANLPDVPEAYPQHVENAQTGNQVDIIREVLNSQNKIAQSSQSQVLNVPKQPIGAFSEKLSTQNIGTSAIVEMAKLPYYQEDAFRPSVLPPSFGSTVNEDTEDYMLEQEPDTEKQSETFSELFSSVSAGRNDTSAPTSLTGEKNSLQSVTPEEDEQSIPNFLPGKPAFWMNMYYPNGVPVLMKVTTTTQATTTKPRKRRRRTTKITTTTSNPAVDAEYYDYESEDGTKSKKKKKKPE